MVITSITDCRVCGSSGLSDILDLGEQFVIDFPIDENEGIKAPLQLVLCPNCTLVQLKHSLRRDLLYRRYWYRSGVSPMMVQALADIVMAAEKRVALQRNDIVIDIGANDGTLLRQYSSADLRRIGFEPAANLIPHASDSGDIINDYFTANGFLSSYPNERAKIITAIAMFYDLEDANEFVSDIRKILDPDGVFIIQMNYLGTMLERNTFDNICHEHLEYYSLASLRFLLEKHGLEIFDIELNEVNGGSFRIYTRNKGSETGGTVSDAVGSLEREETRNGLQRQETYMDFARRVTTIGEKLHNFISEEVRTGKRVYVNGASTRGNTILQFAKLDCSLIRAAADRNPEKWGRKIVGTRIPIISKEQARGEKPDYYLVLPYGFLSEISNEEKAFLEDGGKFIVPIPLPRIVTFDHEWLI